SVREARKIGSLGGLDTRTWPVFVTSYLLWTCYSIRIGDVWVCLASIFGSVTWLYFCLTAIRLTSQEEGELGPTCSSEPWEGGLLRRRAIDLHQCSKFYRKATIDKTEKGLAAGLGFTFCVAFACSPWNIEELNFLEAIITPEIKLSVFSSICGFSTLLLFINPLSRLWILVKRRDASTIFLPIVMAQLVQNLLWAAYGILALEPGLYVPSGFGVFVVLAQLLLKCVFRGAGAAVEDPALEEEPGLFMDSLTPIPCDKPVTTFGRRHNTIDLPDVSSRLKAQHVYEDYLNSVREARKIGSLGGLDTRTWPVFVTSYLLWTCYSIRIGDVWVCLASIFGSVTWLYFCLTAIRLTSQEEGELGPTCSSEPWEGGMVRRRAIDLHQCSKFYRKATIDKTEKGLAAGLGFTFCLAFACSPWNIEELNFLEAIITPEIKLSVFSSICGFSTLVLFINPLSRLWILVKRRDASTIFLPIVMAQLVQNLLWAAYGILALEPGLCVLSGFGVFVVVAQLLLKCVFRGADAAVEDPALEEEPELLMESLTPIPCGKPVTTFGRRHNTIDLPDVSNRLKAQRVYEDYLNSVREARKIGSLGGLDTRTWPVFVTSYLLWTCYSIRIGDVWVCLASIFGSVTWLYFCLTAIRLTSQEEGELGPTCSSEPWEGGMVRRRTIDLHQCSKFYRKATIDKTEKGLAAGLGFTFCVAFACSPWNIEELNFLEAIITPEIKLSVFSSICGFSTLLLFINPLSRLWILVKRRDASTIFLPIVMAQLVQNLLWATYGILALEPGLYVPSGFGVFVVLAQLLLKCVFRGAGAAVEDPALEEEPGLFMDSLTPIPCDKPVTTFGRRHNTIDLPDVSSRLKAQCVYEDYLKWQEANRKRRQGYTHSALGELTDGSASFSSPSHRQNRQIAQEVSSISEIPGEVHIEEC
ncbi:unnamed protein product, partial [Polarella glacialis]